MNEVEVVEGPSQHINVASFLVRHRATILDAAMHGARGGALTRYRAEGSIDKRLAALFDLLVESVDRKDLTIMVAYARDIATQRFEAGFDLVEVQAAFNLLEEACWSSVLEQVPAADLAEALGLVATVLGAGKDALARAYVSLATRMHVPSLDLTGLFDGTDEPAWTGREPAVRMDRDPDS